MDSNCIRVIEVVNVNKPSVKPKRFSGPVECACCGRTVTNIHVLADGRTVGSECAGVIETPLYRLGRKPTSKQLTFFNANGLTWPKDRMVRNPETRKIELVKLGNY